ncbi:hypothetical protein [Streptomyces sp. NPDC127038]|uniref:DUF7574 domain-containing protein n=1 Tax=Streptomyces sp. NPDC127038 TaxID=3347114 RepID=UPI003651BE01
MSYSDIYGSPEKYGLRTIGEVQWGDACYSFDLTVVWQDTTTGALYFADDSGCSCPSPFNMTGRDGLTHIDRPQTLIDHLNDRIKQGAEGYWSESETEAAKADAGALVLKARGVLR